MTELLNAMPDLPLLLKLALLALPMLLNLWGIWHAFARRAYNPMLGTVWLCVCVFLPVLGGLAYLLFGRVAMNNAVKAAKEDASA